MVTTLITENNTNLFPYSYGAEKSGLGPFELIAWQGCIFLGALGENMFLCFFQLLKVFTFLAHGPLPTFSKPQQPVEFFLTSSHSDPSLPPSSAFKDTCYYLDLT